MPKLRVYLPKDLHVAVKEHGFPASEMLQKAVREEIRRLELIKAGEEYLADLIEEVGEPSPADKAWARDLMDRATRRSEQASG